jgi:hypothetical protein
MGCCKSKEIINNINIGEYIIKLFNSCDNNDHILNLDRAIKLYEYEKNKMNGGDIDYKTKCIIVMCFIRDIDKIICINKNTLKMNDNKKNEYISNFLIKIKLPIFIIEQLEQYRNNNITDSLSIMGSFDIDKNILNKSYEQKINIIINLINNIQNI